MARTAILAIRIISDASNAAAGFNQAEGSVSKFQSGLSKAAGIATAVTAGMVAIGAASVQAASDAQQAAGAVESVFGSASAEVLKYGDNAAQSVGLAASSYNQLASVLGAQLGNLGIAQTEVAGTTNELITLGADLAATFGGETSDAVSALSSLFRGEMDPIEKYGVSIKQADVNARLAQQGLSGLTGEAKTQAETAAKLALVYEQTAAAQGSFARESNTLAGQQQRMNAEFENAKASLGQALLPILTQVAQVLAQMAGWISDNSTAFWVIAGVVGTVAVALVTLNAAMTAYQVISGIITAVNAVAAGGWLATAAAEMAALWPLALIVVAILAVIAVIVLIVKNLDFFRGVWDAVWAACETAVNAVWNFLKQVASWIAGAFTATVDAIGNVFSTAFGIAKRVVEAMLSPINAVINAVQSLIGWISNIRFPSMPSWLSNLNPFSATLAPDTPAVSAFAAPAPSRSALFSPFGVGGAPKITASMTNVNIVIKGAIDPVETGKQVRKALTTSGRGLGLSAAVVMSSDRSTY